MVYFNVYSIGYQPFSLSPFQRSAYTVGEIIITNTYRGASN